MEKLTLLTPVLLGSIFGIQFLIPITIMGQAATESAPPCENARQLSSHPLSELPPHIQSILRQAVRPRLQAIISDPGMGMSDAVAETVPLNVSEIARTAGPNVLYMVSWDDRSFGINGLNWIVELTPNGAASLLSAHASSLAGGYGVEVLGTQEERYPELMIASKGYAQGGGAEAEAGCFRKAGHFYESTSCPASCQDELNSH